MDFILNYDRELIAIAILTIIIIATFVKESFSYRETMFEMFEASEDLIAYVRIVKKSGIEFLKIEYVNPRWPRFFQQEIGDRYESEVYQAMDYDYWTGVCFWNEICYGREDWKAIHKKAAGGTGSRIDSDYYTCKESDALIWRMSWRCTPVKTLWGKITGNYPFVIQVTKITEDASRDFRVACMRIARGATTGL